MLARPAHDEEHSETFKSIESTFASVVTRLHGTCRREIARALLDEIRRRFSMLLLLVESRRR
jgi:hypothetical protein